MTTRVPFLLSALSLALISSTSSRADSLVLGGGCFWCLDATFKLKSGVTAVTCGYAGGSVDHPTYAQVCRGDTGHAEVVKIDYDPAKIGLTELLSFFWKVHNPCQVGGQGNDHGSQYRSIILYADAGQKAAAELSRAQAAQLFSQPLTTEIVALTRFWPAEEYHQDYFAKNPEASYCAYVIQPKVDKLKKDLAPHP